MPEHGASGEYADEDGRRVWIAPGFTATGLDKGPPLSPSAAMFVRAMFAIGLPACDPPREFHPSVFGPYQPMSSLALFSPTIALDWL